AVGRRSRRDRERTRGDDAHPPVSCAQEAARAPRNGGPMTDPVDVLIADAIGAARDRANDGVDDGAETRLKLRESLAGRPQRRRRLTIIAAVIASLFGSTAFAFIAGWRPLSTPPPEEPPPVIAAPIAAP